MVYTIAELGSCGATRFHFRACRVFGDKNPLRSALHTFVESPDPEPGRRQASPTFPSRSLTRLSEAIKSTVASHITTPTHHGIFPGTIHIRLDIQLTSIRPINSAPRSSSRLYKTNTSEPDTQTRLNSNGPQTSCATATPRMSDTHRCLST